MSHLVFLEGTWLNVSLVIGILGLVILGIVKHKSLGDDMVFPSVMVIITIAIFWPLALILLAFCASIASPIYLGKYIGKLIDYISKSRKHKIEEETNSIELMLKKKKE